MQRYAVGFKLLYPIFYPIDLTWAQEVCVYMFVWMAKFGAAYGVRTGIHVGVDVLVNQLSPARRRPVILFGLFCGALFTFVIGTMGAKFVSPNLADQVSPDLEIPIWIVYLCIPIGSYLMCFRFLQVGWTFFRTGDLPRHDPGQVEGVDTAAIVPRVRRDERRLHLPPADRAHADRHAHLDRARPHRARLHVHDHDGADRTVALELFTGIPNFEIMAIPFFILAGNFLTHGGVARRMLHFASTMVGTLVWRAGLAGVMACALVRRHLGLLPATVVAIGSIILPAMVQQGFPSGSAPASSRPPARSAS